MIDAARTGRRLHSASHPLALAGVKTHLEGAYTVSPSFVADAYGDYVVQLLVSDPGSAAPRTRCTSVSRTSHWPTGAAIRTASAAVAEVMDVQQSVATVPDIALKNATMTNALNNKLNSVIQKIQAGDYAAALSQLENDILPKTDGCATSTPPTPDNNDWITSCSEQAVVYEQLLQLIADVTLVM